MDLLGAVYLPLNPGWTARRAGRVLRDRAPALLVADMSLRHLADVRAGSVQVVEAAALDDVFGGPGPAPEVVSDRGERSDLDDCEIVHNSGLPGIHHGVCAAGQVHTVGDASIHPIVVKRAGYLFAADLEAEIVDLGTGVTSARARTRLGAVRRNGLGLGPGYPQIRAGMAGVGGRGYS